MRARPLERDLQGSVQIRKPRRRGAREDAGHGGVIDDIGAKVNFQ